MALPAVKYGAVALLYRAHPEALWEHEVFKALERAYEPSALHCLREDFISLATIGWVEVREERPVRGRLLRKYALKHEIRRFVEYQLDIASLVAFVERRCLGRAPVAGSPAADRPADGAIPATEMRTSR